MKSFWLSVVMVGVLIPLSVRAGETQLKKTDAVIIKRLQAMFPRARRVEPSFVFLTPQQKQKVKEKAGFEPDTRMFRVYRVWNDAGRVLAYGFLDTHILRTHYETVLFVIKPDGTIHEIQILDFEEPPDYRPLPRWLDTLKNKKLAPDYRVGQQIPNMSGATITAHAIVRRARLILAVWEIVFGGN